MTTKTYTHVGCETHLPESYAQLVQAIDDQFKKTQPSSKIMHAIGEQLKQFGKDGMIKAINAYLQNQVWLDELAKHAYLHNNGFYKIPLHNSELFTLRLHIWLPGKPAMETLHNHRWHIASHVLSGELVSEIWEDSISADAVFCDEFLYLDKNTPPKYLGKARVGLAETCIQKQGESYSLAPHKLHRIIHQGDKMVATIMCRTNNVTNWARNVIVNKQIPDVQPVYITSDQLKNVLERYLELNQLAEEIAYNEC